jgi:hypothetical protein
MNKKKTISLDFDGVCHQYTTRYLKPGIISDSPVDGLFEFLDKIIGRFDIVIFSSRNYYCEGIYAMSEWFEMHYYKWIENGGKPINLKNGFWAGLRFPSKKPDAMIFIDDHNLSFNGIWPTVNELSSFKPWNK